MLKLRRWQISLRALLLLIIALALGLGWRLHKARQQAALVAAIESFGGWVYYDYDFVDGQRVPPSKRRDAPLWLRRTFGDELFREIRQVVLVYNDAAAFRANHPDVMTIESLLGRIAAESSVKSLDLNGVSVTDEGLGPIGKMRSLEQLIIAEGSPVTDAGVAHLAHLGNLREVRIPRSRISDDSLILLSGLPSMENLSLEGNHFTDRGLTGLQGRESLKIVWIGHGDLQFSDAALAHLKGFNKLEVLDIEGAPVTANGIKQLRGLKKLRVLYVNLNRRTDEEWRALEEAFPKVTLK
jgi:hypothetical protein